MASQQQQARNAKPSVEFSDEEIGRLIRESAYYRAEARGFVPGQEMQDWLQAEAEVRRRLSS